MRKDHHFINPEKTIRFSHNWNGKLRCRFFTTIRLESHYYKPGDHYQIWVKEKDLFQLNEKGSPVIRDVYAFKALLHEKKTLLLHQLPPMTAAIDTGYSLPEAKALFTKFYPKADWNTQLITICLLENIEFLL